MASKQIFLANNAWQSLTAYVVGQQIVSGGFIQQVTTPGTSGGSAPGFSSTTGNTTADGSVVWICVGPTSAPVWLVPSDFSPINTIECIGGGGCGGDGSAGVAGGGGGGAYAKITHLILAQGASVPYQIGAGGVTGGAPSAGGAGGGTWFNGFTYSASSVAAQGGGGGSFVQGNSATPVAGGSGGLASASIGTTTIDGGSGASGQTLIGTGAPTAGGGGGAAGPNGIGGSGGSSDSATTGAAAGGGGGNGGGQNGVGGSNTYGNGGNNYLGAGAGTGSAGGATAGAAGGGGGGAQFPVGGAGGPGQDWTASFGSGGGGGGGVDGGGAGGLYGGGSGGAGGGASGHPAPGGQGIIVITYEPFPRGWLIVDEPSIGLTDRSSYLYLGDGAQHTFNLQLRQRGNATFTLISNPGDPTSVPANYLPTLFQPIYLFDQNESGYTLVFTGLIQDYTVRWVATGGLFFIDVTAVSLEQVFDTVYADGTDLFTNATCGSIVTALYNKYETGAPVGLGTISAGATLPTFNPPKGAKLSELFDQLATTSQFVWGVNAQTQQLYFYVPSTSPAPFSLTSTEALWDTISDKTDGADYRNRQAVKISYDAFEHSKEFFVGAGQINLTLSRPVEQITNAWATLSTCNTATGTFSGQPSPGDTITIGPANGTWVCYNGSNPYALGGIIISGGYVYKVTTAGNQTACPGGPPNFAAATVTGDTVYDNSVIWTCQGPSGLATGTQTYTFVSSMAGYYGPTGVWPPSAANPTGQMPTNVQFGLVLIGATDAATAQNLVDAINATVTRAGVQLRGVTFSLPTWECSQCNAIGLSGLSFTLQQKSAGSGWVSQMSTTSANFAWSAANTNGGTSPQGSLGPNEGATIELSVYALGTSTAAPGLAYTQGSTAIQLATPLNSGSNLNVEYTRTDGNVIEVEDTSLVIALATVTDGTGKIQQITDQSSQGLISTSSAAGLQFAQESLAAYDVPPAEIEVQLHQPGLLPGQLLTFALTEGPQVSLNGTYFVEEVRAEIVPTYPYLDNPNAVNAGHYRYTAKVIDVAQIASYMDFWEGLGGGSSGGGAGSSLVATSGGSQSTSGTTPTTGGVNEQTASYAATAGDSGKLIVFNVTASSTLTLPVPPSSQFNLFVQSISPEVILFATTGGATIDGRPATDFRQAQFQGVYLTTDGTNWFSSRSVLLGTATVQTVNVTLTATARSGVLLAFNSSSALTLTLPAAPPFVTWLTFVQCIGSGGLTINPNGLDIDGSASSLVLTQGQGVIIFTDGTNYFTMRGMGGGGSSVTLQTNSVNNSSQTTLNVENGTNTTASNPSGGVVQIAVATATSAALGVVQPDGTVITVSAGVITVPDATSSSLGVVKPDGTIITVSAGAITVPDGTNSSLGVVQADGTTTSISSGIISALGGAGLVSGACFLPAFSVVGASSDNNWENYTLMNSWSGLNLNFFPASGKWKIKLLFTAGSPAIGNMVIKRTLNHSLAVVDTTSVTIGGVSNPSLSSPGLVTTDAILLALDSTHDYYFMIFFSNVAGNASVGVATTFTGASSPFVFSFEPTGDQTGVTTISTGSSHGNLLVTGLYVA